MSNYYSSDQVFAEIRRVGGYVEDLPSGGTRYNINQHRAAKRRLKCRDVAPARGTFEMILAETRTPWGKPQSVKKLTDGLYFCSTASHGGLWLSDAWIKKLPNTYKPFTGTKRWAEEDCDSAEVLQYFGLLSLVSEPMALSITAVDIAKGRESRQTWRGENWFSRPRQGQYTDMDGHYGGPISEAYCRVIGHTESLISTYRTLQLRPGIWRYCAIGEAGAKFIKAFDADEPVEPITLTLEPYVYVPYSAREQTA